MSRQDEADLIKGLTSFDAGSHAEVIRRLGVERTYSLISAAFLVAVEREFPDGARPGEVMKFARRLPVRFPDVADEIDTTAVTAVIRAALGETDQADSLPRNDILTTMFVVTYAIMSIADLDAAGLDDYVDEVIQVADADADSADADSDADD